MKLNYTVISSNPLKVKFFYEDSDKKRYGEFFMEFDRFSLDLKNSTDKLGVTGKAEIFNKDPNYSNDLVLGFRETMEDK